MLESEFSLELGDLMEVHLEEHNSFPMFMAALLMDLFAKSFCQVGLPLPPSSGFLPCCGAAPFWAAPDVQGPGADSNPIKKGLFLAAPTPDTKFFLFYLIKILINTKFFWIIPVFVFKLN